MKYFDLSVAVALLSALPSVVRADYACSLANAQTPSQLGQTLGGSSGGSSSIPNYSLPQSGCSFLIASGAGTCTTTKAKREAEERAKRATTTYSTLPCLDRMSCVNLNSHLYCLDVNTLDYIDEFGACGNGKTDFYKENCLTDTSGSSTSSSPSSSVSSKPSSTGKGTSATSTAVGSSSSVTQSNDAISNLSVPVGFMVALAMAMIAFV